jgi:hypothetical protein
MKKEIWSMPEVKVLDVKNTESGPNFNVNEDPFANFYGPVLS